MPALPQILLVDDDSEICWLVARGLIRSGYDVITAPSLAGALQRLSLPRKFHAIISDYQLPDGTGLDLLARLESAGPGRPFFVLISGYGTVFDLDEDALRCRPDRVLAKPLSMRELLAALPALEPAQVGPRITKKAG